MNNSPLVSVLLAVFNGSTYLSAQIESILSQTYRNIELIINDDGSNDLSLSLAQEFSKKDKRVKVFSNVKRLGVTANFIRSLRHTHGEFICFSDQDDYWRSDKIECLMRLIQRNQKNVLAYSDLEVCNENLRTIHQSFWKLSGIRPRRGALRELALLRNITPGCSMMFRKEIRDILLVLPAECSMMHDHLAFIIASSIGRIIYSSETLVQYRQHQHNTIGALGTSVWNRKRFQEELSKEIRILRPYLPINLDNIENFLNDQAHQNILSRLRFIRYYLFLRPDTLFSKLLGIFECFSPGLYQRLRQKSRAVSN